MKKLELLIKSREAMLAAVQIYNNPQITFKSENFISLAIIAWTYLLHAYYANKSIDYRYFEKKGKRKILQKTKYGAIKHWELERCLDYKDSPIDKDTSNNLKFLIGIRHEIEHQMTNQIDNTISAKLQACSINYNYYIKKLFGEKYGVDQQLGFAIQFSPIEPEQKQELFNNNKLSNNVKHFISEFEDNLSDDDASNPKYAYRVLFARLNAKRKNQADQVIEFLPSGTEGAENLNKTYTLIKEIEKKKYTATEVVQKMHEKGYLWFKTSKMTDFWKNELGSRDQYGIRLNGNWLWYENWLPVIEEYCKKINPTIKQENYKNGYYPNDIVEEMHKLGYSKFSMNSFVRFKKDVLHIDNNDTKYCYQMNNKRYVWNKEFLSLVKKYCETHHNEFTEE